MSILVNFLIAFMPLHSIDPALQRPQPDKILKIIEVLNLTEEQKNTISKDLEKNLKVYDKKRKEYDKLIDKKNKLEVDINLKREELIDLNKRVVAIIKEYLDEEQLKEFSNILKKQKEKTDKQNVELKDQKEDSKDNLKNKNKYEEERKSPFDIYFP